MALTSIANIVPGLTSESVGPETDSQQAAQGTGTPNLSTLASLIEDSFTPSNQGNSPQNAAQEAGLFQVTQVALFATASGSPAAQATQPPANPAPVPAPVTAANISATPPERAPSPAAATTASAQAPSAAAVQPAPVADTQSQIQIQAFNQALTALGLTNSDIQKLDRIAALVNDFSPNAFNDLIGQFQALAQQAAQLSAVNTSGSASASSGAYQVQALSIQFNGSQPSTAGGAAQASASGLLLGSVQFTLAGPSGQPADLFAPQPKPNTATAG